MNNYAIKNGDKWVHGYGAIDDAHAPDFVWGNTARGFNAETTLKWLGILADNKEVYPDIEVVPIKKYKSPEVTHNE